MGTGAPDNRPRGSFRARVERIASLAEQSFDGIIVLDSAGLFEWSNAGITRITGFTPAELIGRGAFELVHPEDIEAAVQALARAVDGLDEGRCVEMRVQHRSGRWIPVEVVGTTIDGDASAGIVVNVRDVSERKIVERKLREARTMFAEVFEHAPVGVALALPSGKFFLANPAFCTMLGYTLDDIADLGITDVTHPDDRRRTTDQYQTLYDGSASAYCYEKRFVRKDGSMLWCRVHVSVVRDENDALEYSIGQLEDITDQRAIAERLEREARHDSLTDLPTRKHLVDRIERALDASRRGGHGQVAVLFIDLDHFKQVNDTLGHAAGDELLIAVAHAIQGSLRGSDIAGRFGGDEFVVLCPQLASPTDATVVADRIRRRLAQPFTVRETEVFVGASIGIAIADHVSDAATLFSEADTAAYRAKERGRNRVELFDRELRATIARRVQTEASLRHALESNELRLHYQPVIAVDSGALSGFEALVRWERPGHGLVTPADFLAIAEERGLIVPIGRWITETACRQLAEWDRLAPRRTHMAINLSPRQLGSGHLVREVQEILRDTGVDPARVCLEITENALVDDAEAAIGRLEELRGLGVRLAIDDFGTGYSSLSYLRRLPVSVVKIDRSFVLALGTDREGSTIVASVINLAHALGMEIVAEGVESIEHVAALVTLDCDHMQGYYFSPPVEAGTATELLLRNATGWNTGTAA